MLFGAGEFSELNDNDLETLAAEIPAVSTGRSIIEALVEAGVATSNGEARRLISGGAISVNGQKINDDQQITETSLIKKGKNNFVLVR